MSSILGSKTVMVVVLTVLLAGDMFRHALTVPVWVAIAVAAGLWGIAVLITHRVTWRQFPLPLLVVLAWWAITPAWSTYPATSALMLIPGSLLVVLGAAVVIAAPLDEFIRRSALSLRIVLTGSIVFEIAVALYGRPVYPVGFIADASTPIELAWSRALFFSPGERIQGLVGNANTLGMLALVMLIIAAWRMYASRNWRTISALDALIGAFVILRTMSATVTVAILGIAVVLVLASLARRTGIAWRIAFGVAVAGIVGAVATALAQWTTVVGLLGKSPDLTHRLDIWAAVSERIATRPVLGHGFVGWWPSWDPWFQIHAVDGLPMSQAHNVWLDITMQTGLIGVVLFAIALGGILWMLWRAFLESPRSVAAVPFLVLVALTVQSLAESRMLHEWGFASVVAFAIVAERLRAGFIALR